MTASPRRVIVIDDSDVALLLVRGALESSGFEVHTFTSVFAVTPQLDVLKPSAIVLDLLMPAIGGDKVVDVFRRNAPKGCPIILYSGAPDNELRARALACEADAYIRKSHDLSALVRCLREKVGMNG